MFKVSLLMALALGFGLDVTSAAEPPEKSATPLTRQSAPPTIRALPPVEPESRPAADRAKARRGEALTPSASAPRPAVGGPESPFNPQAPLISIQVVMAEFVSDAAAKSGLEPRPSSLATGPMAGMQALDAPVSEENIQERLRKLGMRGRLEVLYWLRLTAADRQSGSVEFGQSEPRITGVSSNQFGRTNTLQYTTTGLRVEIEPRVTGQMVSMKVNLGASRLGRPEEGTPISVPAKGEPIRALRMQQINLRTTVNAPIGQSVTLTGLTEEDGPRRRQVMVFLCPHVVPLEAPREPVRPAP